MKSIEQSTKKVPSENIVKAYLIGLGDGLLEFVDNTIKFHTQKGHIRKKLELSKEIPMSDIDSINRVGNELSITWKGSIDLFIIEESEFVGTIFEKITGSSEEQKKPFEVKNKEKLQDAEVNTLIKATLEITDPLFDILRSLHGWVDWPHIEDLLNISLKKAQELANQKIEWIQLDFSNLTTVLKEQNFEKISREIPNLLKTIYNYFIGKAARNEISKEIHPNYYDAKTIIQAYFLLNDIILGSIVVDKEIGEEQKELLITLENLAKSTKLQINIKAIKSIISKLDYDPEKESIIKKSRMLFRQELKDLITN